MKLAGLEISQYVGDGFTCADEHIKQDLNIESAIVRSPEAEDKWIPHTEISDLAFSPGLKTDGNKWQLEQDAS